MEDVCSLLMHYIAIIWVGFVVVQNLNGGSELEGRHSFGCELTEDVGILTSPRYLQCSTRCFRVGYRDYLKDIRLVL